MQETQAATRRLAERTRSDVTALWALVRSGRLTRAQFRIQASAVVAAANTAGVTVADLGLAAEVTRSLGTPTPPLGLLPNDIEVDQDRMGDDIGRLLGDFDDPEGPLGDWAASETYLTVANTVQTAMAERGIAAWVRVLSGTSCPMCTGWADGIPRPVGTRMARHIGCDCIQQPVF